MNLPIGRQPAVRLWPEADCFASAVEVPLTTRDVAEVLGHANLSNTRRYSALDANRFRGIWCRHK